MRVKDLEIAQSVALKEKVVRAQIGHVVERGLCLLVREPDSGRLKFG